MVAIQKTLSALAAFTAVSYAVPHGFISKTTTTSSTSTTTALEITNISAHQPTKQTQDITFSFVVHDPNPLTNATTLCSYEWKANSSYPEGGYVACVDDSFQFNFADGTFKNIYTYTLQIEHTFTDPAVGAAPYDQITNFAKANVTKNIVDCTTTKSGTHKGEINCVQPKKSTIKAPIWASIA